MSQEANLSCRREFSWQELAGTAIALAKPEYGAGPPIAPKRILGLSQVPLPGAVTPGYTASRAKANCINIASE